MNFNGIRVNVPQVNIEVAIEFYRKKRFLGNKEILEMFESGRGKKLGSTTVLKLKKVAFEYMKNNGYTRFNDYSVTTKPAFEAWGLDINELDKDYNKLKKLGFIKESEVR